MIALKIFGRKKSECLSLPSPLSYRHPSVLIHLVFALIQTSTLTFFVPHTLKISVCLYCHYYHLLCMSMIIIDVAVSGLLFLLLLCYVASLSACVRVCVFDQESILSHLNHGGLCAPTGE